MLLLGPSVSTILLCLYSSQAQGKGGNIAPLMDTTGTWDQTALTCSLAMATRQNTAGVPPYPLSCLPSHILMTVKGVPGPRADQVHKIRDINKYA